MSTSYTHVMLNIKTTMDPEVVGELLNITLIITKHASTKKTKQLEFYDSKGRYYEESDFLYHDYDVYVNAAKNNWIDIKIQEEWNEDGSIIYFSIGDWFSNCIILENKESDNHLSTQLKKLEQMREDMQKLETHIEAITAMYPRPPT